MISVLDVLEKAKLEAVEKQEVRDLRNCQNFKGGRQGDIYIIKISSLDDVKKIEKIIQKNKNKMWSNFTFGEFVEGKTNQLVSGTTKGSRHLFCGEGKILFSKGGHPCAGGLIDAKEDWINSHPEHAHFMYSAGLFLFICQLDASKEREVRRVQD